MQDKSSFKFKVDLFNYGTYNELIFTPEQNGYTVNLDNEAHLGLIGKEEDLTWKVIEGNISRSMMDEIVKCVSKMSA